MFFQHADEERAHGLKFIDYLRMRGNLDEDFFSSLKPIKSKSMKKMLPKLMNFESKSVD